MLEADSITPESLLSICIGQAKSTIVNMLNEFSFEL